jgi:hypothetical protein
MGSNPASNLKLFMLELTFSLPLLQLSFLPVEIPQDVTIINDKNHLRSSVPCLQTSLYRSLCVVYQVHRPLITGCPSGQLQSLQISLYRAPIAGTKFINLSLQITPYKEDEKKTFWLKMNILVKK